MYMKLLIFRKTNSFAKIAVSSPAKVACRLCSFQMKHFSAKSVWDFLQIPPISLFEGVVFEI